MPTFADYVHPVTGKFIWGLIMLLALRGVYTNVVKKEVGHAAAFLAFLLFSAYMFASAMGWVPAGFEEALFQ